MGVLRWRKSHSLFLTQEQTILNYAYVQKKNCYRQTILLNVFHQKLNDVTTQQNLGLPGSIFLKGIFPTKCLLTWTIFDFK